MNRGIKQYHDMEFQEKPLQSESGIVVRDLQGNEYPLQATITTNRELNGNQSISFRVLPSKVNELFIENITEMWEVDTDTTYKIIYYKKRGQGDKLNVEIKAIPKFFDDFDTQRIYEEYNQHMTAQACFNLIFQDSGYNVVINGTFEAIGWEGFGSGDTRLELFKRALNRYKAEFTISGNTIYLENLIGRDTQFMYRYKLNASNIVQENDASAYWTYAKGYGNYSDEDGWQGAKLIREYTHPLAHIPAIGIRHAPPIKNGNITSETTMNEQLKTLVDESLKISVSADIHDLKHYPLAQPEVGDRAFLIDERIGLDTEVRIHQLSVTKDWKGNVINLQAVFGSPNIVKRHQSNLKTAISNITQLIDGKIKLPFSVLDNAVAEATKALQRMESQLSITDNGSLMSVDKTNPNNVVVFNAAGLGVSDDGGATFKNAITGNGINASVITAGVLYGINIQGARFYSESNNTYMEVVGGLVKVVRSDNSRVEITPDGITSYHSDGSIRYETTAQRTSSGAYGTVNTNVYMASNDGGELRVVDISSLPGDGNLNNYRYNDIRAKYIFANMLEANSALTSETNIYLKPRGTGEVRVTTGGTTDTFLPVRANRFYGNAIDVNTQMTGVNNLYLRPNANGEARITLIDSTNAFLPLRASRVYANALDFNEEITNEVNMYIRPKSGGEVRFTSLGTTNSFVNARGNRFFGQVFDINEELPSNITNLYVRPRASGEVIISAINTSDNYRPIRASEFNNSSSVYLKKNIEDYTRNAIDLINSTPVRYFHMLEDIDDVDPKRIGLIVQESPVDIVNINGGDSINIYAMSSLLWKAVQELTKRLEVLENGTT